MERRYDTNIRNLEYATPVICKHRPLGGGGVEPLYTNVYHLGPQMALHRAAPLRLQIYGATSFTFFKIHFIFYEIFFNFSDYSKFERRGGDLGVGEEFSYGPTLKISKF